MMAEILARICLHEMNIVYRANNAIIELLYRAFFVTIIQRDGLKTVVITKLIKNAFENIDIMTAQ